MIEQQTYTHWVEIDGEIVGKAYVNDEGDSTTCLIFVELRHQPGLSFLASINRKNLKPMNEARSGMVQTATT